MAPVKTKANSSEQRNTGEVLEVVVGSARGGVGTQGPAPLMAQRQEFGRLIALGVNNSEACRRVGIHRRTGTRWRFGRTIMSSTGFELHYAPVLRSALNTAVKRRLIPYSPAEQVELAPENPKRPKPWTAEQCQTFLRDIADDRLANLYDLILVTGMRRGEAIGLRWEDVDLEGQCLFVVQQITEVHGRAVVGTPKTKRGTRLVPIDEGTVAILGRHREMQDVEHTDWGPAWNDAGLVFTREDAALFGRSTSLVTSRRWPRLRGCLRSGCTTCGTRTRACPSGGVDMKVVSERLGHSQMSITADLIRTSTGASAGSQLSR
jgi:integrase